MSTSDSWAMATPEADSTLDDERNPEAYDSAYEAMSEAEERDLDDLIGDLSLYLRGANMVGSWSDKQLEILGWAATQPELVELADIHHEGFVARMRQEAHLFADGRMETPEAREFRQRKELFLRGGAVMRGGPLGGMTYFAVKSAGGTEEEALSAGEFANTIVDVIGTHQDGAAPKPVEIE